MTSNGTTRRSFLTGFSPLPFLPLWRQHPRVPGHRFRRKMWGFCPPPAYGAFWRM